MSNKRNGVVCRYGAKGYGFIQDTETQQEFYFHVNDVVGRLALQTGQRVTFEVNPFNKKPGANPSAILVRLLPDSDGSR